MQFNFLRENLRIETKRVIENYDFFEITYLYNSTKLGSMLLRILLNLLNILCSSDNFLRIYRISTHQNFQMQMLTS